MLLTEQNVQQVILQGSQDKAVFVYFFANAPECEQANTAVKASVSENNPYISLAEADVTTAVGQAVAMQLGLRSVPALIVFKKGQPCDALQGDEVVSGIADLVKKYQPSESELLIREAMELEAAGDLNGAIAKACKAYEADPKKLETKLIYARMCIKARRCDKAHELLDNPGREEQNSQDYKDLISALTLAEQAVDSPELKKLRDEHEANPDDDELSAKYAAALSEAGKHKEALDMLLDILKQDLSRQEIKKTYIDILSTLSGDPLQKTYRGKLYTLMY